MEITDSLRVAILVNRAALSRHSEMVLGSISREMNKGGTNMKKIQLKQVLQNTCFVLFCIIYIGWYISSLISFKKKFRQVFLLGIAVFIESLALQP